MRRPSGNYYAERCSSRIVSAMTGTGAIEAIAIGLITLLIGYLLGTSLRKHLDDPRG
jgi:hypothetical protein